ncbi:MAG: c-type cytochrome [Gammaproteobacteria bacterium]|nr:c-type cytochrome [Gammaproteobacteria bacterium]
MKKIILSLSLLFLSAQALAVLNPNPATNKFHWNGDGKSGELRTVTELSGLGGFKVQAIGVATSVVNCGPSTGTYVKSQDPITNEYVLKISGCGVTAFAGKAGSSVNLQYGVSTFATGYTLCIDGDCTPPTAIERGETIVTNKNCASCHGTGLAGGTQPSLIALTNQQLITKLTAYRNQEGSNAIMKGIMENSTDADIANITAYIRSIDPSATLPRSQAPVWGRITLLSRSLGAREDKKKTAFMAVFFIQYSLK